jgi:acyl dehydratase
VPPTVFHDLDELLSAGRRDLGATDWVMLTRSVLTDFSTATWSPSEDDDNVAPPMLLLSLTNRFLPDLLEVRGAASGINYGTGTVRFSPTARAGDQIRASAVLVEAGEVAGAVQTTVEIRIEVQGSEEPACTVESLSRWMR